MKRARLTRRLVMLLPIVIVAALSFAFAFILNVHLGKAASNTLISPLFILLFCISCVLLMSFSWLSLYRYKRGVIEVIDQLTRMHVRHIPDAHFEPQPGGDPVSARVLSLVAKLIDEQATRDKAETLARTHAETARIAARFAHDIRSPITALKIAMDSGMKSEEVNVLIMRACRRIQEISDELLKCAKGKLAQLNVENAAVGGFEYVNIANEVLQPLLAEKKLEYEKSGVAFEFQADSGVHTLANVADLRRTVSNLMNNAVEAVMDCGRAKAVRVHLDSDPSAATARIRIRDSGTGIPHLISGRLGEWGVTSKAGGFGLGLFFAREVVRRHAGELKVENLGGSGTEVSIILPLRGPC